ncbi:MAG: Mur ligase family protein [Capnocytophaga sp.]|nr:Mur ligase family protein [Capnocytophaga sp.]
MRIHFISIAGAAMHNLALALQQKKYQITGSDDVIFEPSRSRLEKAGLLPQELGWFPEKITKDIDAVILGMHAKEDNPELIKAKELGIKIYSYPEFIYEQSKNKTRVVIGGSHGKTTITSMVLYVMNYHNRDVDYLVGAQLEGFETMVKLSDTSEFIVIEGDEYLSSAIDLRPKFHLYKPTLALLSGIAWDHINVFPTEDNYIQQFDIFISSITKGGILIYNEEDSILNKIVEENENPIRKIPYQTPEYFTQNGISFLQTPEGEMPLEIFGKHNMSNLAGAKWICQNMGVDEQDFYEAISTFKGASKRLETITKNDALIVFKDFAHSPSKVRATTNAVREQYPDKQLTACLELYTYSSLNKNFLSHYKDTLQNANEAVILYDREALKVKGISDITEEDIRKAFQHPNLKIFTDKTLFQSYIYNTKHHNSILLFMSSGNYGGIDFNFFK